MDESPMSRSPLVIIGAGIGGLTLGRCLQCHKIPFRIYERADESTRHNYGISLTQRTYQPLLEVLQISEDDFRHSLAVVKSLKAGATAEEWTSNAPKPADAQTGGSKSDFRVNRSAFEQLLAGPIKQHIQYSSRFKSINPATNPSTQVEVIFEASSAVSGLVIDCSGVHSSVRAALLPDRQPVIHPFVAVNGKRYLSPNIWEESYAPEFGSATSLETTVQFEHTHNGTPQSITARLELSINETVLDAQDRLKRASISSTYSRVAFPSSPDALYLPSRPKQAAKDIPQQFFEEMASLTRSPALSPAYKAAFSGNPTDQDRRLNWLLRSIYLDGSDMKKLREQGVVMIGDAAYAEPIVGSVPGGANQVIRQAMRLAERLKVERESGREAREWDLEGWLGENPRSGEEDVAAHLGRIHQPELARAVL
jgi:2-polyprenyl-6-methoxyphenol hydroxylase-like FAD-dependent oxidoreductase